MSGARVRGPAGVPRRKFTGVLAKPIVVTNPASTKNHFFGHDLGPSMLDAVDVDGARSRRLGPLAKHYRVDLTVPDAWRALCLELAQDFVPGFRVEMAAAEERPKGRPRGTGKINLPKLMKAIADRRKGQTVSATCRWLVSQRDPELPGTHEVLEATYHAEKKRLTNEQRARDAAERKTLILAAMVLPQFYGGKG